MPFTPPPFITFKVNTLNLGTRYSTLLGRYTVVDAQNGDSVPQTSLEVLIARTNDVINCKTERVGQRDTLNLLVNEVRHTPNNDKEKIMAATLFLLGALIHRYLRLIETYEGTTGYIPWTYFRCPVTNCKLFLAIRKALKFKDIEYIPKKEFKKDDLKTLDVVTIVKALEAFRDNMLITEEKGIPRYMKYPHFAQDINFLKYLQDIIDRQTRRGSVVLTQFKAIDFIQSLATQIEQERHQLEKDIEKWCKGIEKKYKNFNTFCELDDEAINDSLDEYVVSEISKNIIFGLFSTPLIRDNLKTTDHRTLLGKMKLCYDFTCSHMLWGGYALLLQQPIMLGDDLLFIIRKALGIDSSNELSKADMLNGIKFLKQFLENEPGVVLDCAFFGGGDKMNTFILRTEKELTSFVSQKIPNKSADLVC